ncbi:hypothetical protein VPFG_00093 [Vibrio phage nt-1]|uniref:Uncharacterized protein n=1 Tax=Vibrio phage nt-1 TaxID=115992 RepID=R9TIB2_9CAUD|nr:hypothetical protein VPFG_00093 [Vibrio phage nt-1]AGN30095.2 hypothetical protein VPFG_00093 [Vibrio phage nt-1]
MITAKEARARRKSLPAAVQSALDDLNLAIQVASSSKNSVMYKTDKLTSNERDLLRNKLISLGYDAFIVGEKLEVVW